nr:MAG TPA: hypothetical protein [Caudoviricetes sp.]
MGMKIKIDFGSISVKPIKVEPYLAKRLISVVDLWWNSVPGGTKRYYGTRGWQRSCRNHAVKSRVRHAKRKATRGYRYKGGK